MAPDQTFHHLFFPFSSFLYPPTLVAEMTMFRQSLVFLTLFSVIQVALAATAEQWRGRAIYELVTDRFARTDGSTTAACNTADRKFCGGSWRGLINKLDYIKGMGFDAVCLSPSSAWTHIY